MHLYILSLRNGSIQKHKKCAHAKSRHHEVSYSNNIKKLDRNTARITYNIIIIKEKENEVKLEENQTGRDESTNLELTPMTSGSRV